MKLDRENSAKNIYAKELDFIEEQIERIETTNGRLTITSAIAAFSMFTCLLNAISYIGATHLNVALGILNIVIMMLSGLVLDRSFVKITKNNKLKEEIELKLSNIIQSIKNDEFLEAESQEMNKVLCKKNNIVYFPQK